ncbi:MAG: hypothetical protein OXH72_03460 [Caldilineaceae bacterium]|nr:hypothetical protein [Caldilineaceae bacterium]
MDHLHDIPLAPDNDAFELPSRTRDYTRRHRSLMSLSVTAIISAVRRLIGSSVLFVE